MKCSCNMLWLHSWLQQHDQNFQGPRCSDGILLREHRISKNNCDDFVETVPGCDAKHSASPPSASTNGIHYYVPYLAVNFESHLHATSLIPEIFSSQQRPLFQLLQHLRARQCNLVIHKFDQILKPEIS